MHHKHWKLRVVSLSSGYFRFSIVCERERANERASESYYGIYIYLSIVNDDVLNHNMNSWWKVTSSEEYAFCFAIQRFSLSIIAFYWNSLENAWICDVKVVYELLLVSLIFIVVLSSTWLICHVKVSDSLHIIFVYFDKITIFVSLSFLLSVSISSILLSFACLTHWSCVCFWTARKLHFSSMFM